jgi:hypothetical protein
MGARGSSVSLGLGAWASGVFVVLWVGAAIGLAGGGAPFDQAWAWIWGLGTVAAVVVWILFLPICIGLWLTQASLPMLVTILVVALLVAWTALAWGGLAREVTRRRRQG